MNVVLCLLTSQQLKLSWMCFMSSWLWVIYKTVWKLKSWLELFLAGTHSLKYFITASSQVPNFPEFVAVCLVDEVQIGYYDSNTKKAEPKQDWMLNATVAQFWETHTQLAIGQQQFLINHMEILKKRFNQTGGLFTFNSLIITQHTHTYTHSHSHTHTHTLSQTQHTLIYTQSHSQTKTLHTLSHRHNHTLIHLKARTHTHKHSQTQSHLHIKTLTHNHIHTYTHTNTKTHIQTHSQTDTHKHTHSHTYPNSLTHINTLTHTIIYTLPRTQSYSYIWTHTHTDTLKFSLIRFDPKYLQINQTRDQ